MGIVMDDVYICLCLESNARDNVRWSLRHLVKFVLFCRPW